MSAILNSCVAKRGTQLYIKAETFLRLVENDTKLVLNRPEVICILDETELVAVIQPIPTTTFQISVAKDKSASATCRILSAINVLVGVYPGISLALVGNTSPLYSIAKKVLNFIETSTFFMFKRGI